MWSRSSGIRTWHMAQREIPWPLSETSTGGSLIYPVLPQRLYGASVLLTIGRGSTNARKSIGRRSSGATSDNITPRYPNIVHYYSFFDQPEAGPTASESLQSAVEPQRPGFTVQMKGFLATDRTNASCPEM